MPKITRILGKIAASFTGGCSYAQNGVENYSASSVSAVARFLTNDEPPSYTVSDELKPVAAASAPKQVKRLLATAGDSIREFA